MVVPPPVFCACDHLTCGRKFSLVQMLVTDTFSASRTLSSECTLELGGSNGSPISSPQENVCPPSGCFMGGTDQSSKVAFLTLFRHSDLHDAIVSC